MYGRGKDGTLHALYAIVNGSDGAMKSNCPDNVTLISAATGADTTVTFRYHCTYETQQN